MSYHLDIQTQIGPACVRAKCFVVKWLELLSTGKSLCFHGLKTILVNVNFTFCFWNFLTWAFNFIYQSMAYAYVDFQIESKTVVPTINNIFVLVKQRTNWNEKNTFFGFSNALVLRCFLRKKIWWAVSSLKVKIGSCRSHQILHFFFPESCSKGFPNTPGKYANT